eukprot:TRINITY_DN27749_c0_g1_i1.p1 TRINITY_DN27749_c0_g1~~TRINITY_DN27749_c0_g1_i1.p1  ORF type:complete len:284 (-),score=16.62 TRINITY_DN27749_c0_g1_i1:523-1335(-)
MASPTLPLPACWRTGPEGCAMSSPTSPSVAPLTVSLQMPQPGQVIIQTPVSQPCLPPSLPAGPSGAIGLGLKLPVRRRNVTFAEPPVEASAEGQGLSVEYAVVQGRIEQSPSVASARSLDLERAGSTRHGQAFASQRGLTPMGAASPGPYVALYMGTPRTPCMSPCSGKSGYGDSSGAANSQRHVTLNVRETPSGSTPRICGSPASSYEFWRYMAYAGSPLVGANSAQGKSTGLVAPVSSQPVQQQPSSPVCRSDAVVAEAVRRPMRRYV